MLPCILYRGGQVDDIRSQIPESPVYLYSRDRVTQSYKAYAEVGLASSLAARQNTHAVLMRPLTDGTVLSGTVSIRHLSYIRGSCLPGLPGAQSAGRISAVRTLAADVIRDCGRMPMVCSMRQVYSGSSKLEVDEGVLRRTGARGAGAHSVLRCEGQQQPAHHETPAGSTLPPLHARILGCTYPGLQAASAACWSQSRVYRGLHL